ncbi:MAG: S41 family peptidase [Geminicoccaceae bacterium]
MAAVRTGTVATFVFSLATAAPATDLAYQRAVDDARASAVIPADVVDYAREACTTALCFAEVLAKELPDRIGLEPVTHPDTDTIRWAKTSPSIIANNTDDTLTFNITHFGRKAVAELREALTGAGQRLVVDLRGNPGGDFERMLAIAGFLLGPRSDTVEIDYGDRIERRSLEGPSLRSWRIVSVRTDEKTASAALLLARLIEAHSNAEVAGPPAGVAGPPPDDRPLFLKRRIPINHDWRLVLPVAELRVSMPR